MFLRSQARKRMDWKKFWTIYHFSGKLNSTLWLLHSEGTEKEWYLIYYWRHQQRRREGEITINNWTNFFRFRNLRLAELLREKSSEAHLIVMWVFNHLTLDRCCIMHKSCKNRERRFFQDPSRASERTRLFNPLSIVVGNAYERTATNTSHQRKSNGCAHFLLLGT